MVQTVSHPFFNISVFLRHESKLFAILVKQLTKI